MGVYRFFVAVVFFFLNNSAPGFSNGWRQFEIRLFGVMSQLVSQGTTLKHSTINFLHSLVQSVHY